MASAPPIFVLCCARTGSTLLRYILDTHPDIFCPPELHLCELAEKLRWVLGNITDFKPNTSDVDQQLLIAQKVQKQINQIMSVHAKNARKQIWCEKSVRTINHMPLIDSIFPKAKHLCLYRNSLDQLSSAMDTFEDDPTGNDYGFLPFLQSVNFDRANGLADHWISMTTANLGYEKLNPDRCHRVRYESIVTDSENTLKKLFKFLGVKWDPQLLDRVFNRKRIEGPGDEKIRSTNRIESSSLNKDSHGFLEKITPDRIQKINNLHDILGYPPIAN